MKNFKNYFLILFLLSISNGFTNIKIEDHALYFRDCIWRAINSSVNHLESNTSIIKDFTTYKTTTSYVRNILQYESEYLTNNFIGFDREALFKIIIDYYLKLVLKDQNDFIKNYSSKLLDHNSFINNITVIFNKNSFIFGDYTKAMLKSICEKMFYNFIKNSYKNNSFSTNSIVSKEMFNVISNPELIKEIKELMNISRDAYAKFITLLSSKNDEIIDSNNTFFNPKYAIDFMLKNYKSNTEKGLNRKNKFDGKQNSLSMYLHIFILNTIKILECIKNEISSKGLSISECKLDNSVQVALNIIEKSLSIKKINNNIKEEKEKASSRNEENSYDLIYNNLFEFLEEDKTCEIFKIFFNSVSYIDIILSIYDKYVDGEICLLFNEDIISEGEFFEISLEDPKHPALMKIKNEFNENNKCLVNGLSTYLTFGASGSGKTTLQSNYFNNLQLLVIFGLGVGKSIKISGTKNIKKIIFIDYSKICQEIERIHNDASLIEDKKNADLKNNNAYKNKNVSDGQMQLAALKYISDSIVSLDNAETFFIVSFNEPLTNVPADSFGLVGMYFAQIQGSKNAFTLINTHNRAFIKYLAELSKEGSIKCQFNNMLMQKIGTGIFKPIHTFKILQPDEVLSIKGIKESNSEELILRENSMIDVFQLLTKAISIIYSSNDQLNEFCGLVSSL